MKIKLPIIWLLVALIIFIFSFFQGESTLDIHMHDTYFVVAYTHICWLFSFLCFLFAGLYIAFNNILWSKWFSWFHLIGTIIFSFVFIYNKNFNSNLGIPPRYFDYSSLEAFYQFIDLNPLTGFLLLVFLFAQSIFIINLLIGIINTLFTHKQH